MLLLRLLPLALAAMGVWELRAIRKNMMTRKDMPHWFSNWVEAEEARKRAEMLRIYEASRPAKKV